MGLSEATKDAWIPNPKAPCRYTKALSKRQAIKATPY